MFTKITGKLKNYFYKVSSINSLSTSSLLKNTSHSILLDSYIRLLIKTHKCKITVFGFPEQLKNDVCDNLPSNFRFIN